MDSGFYTQNDDVSCPFREIWLPFAKSCIQPWNVLLLKIHFCGFFFLKLVLTENNVLPYDEDKATETDTGDFIEVYPHASH